MPAARTIPTHAPDAPARRSELDADELEALERMASTLTASGEYRVLRRFRPRASYGERPASGAKRGVIVDVETTGTDVAQDAIIELAVLPFEFDSDGRVYGVSEPSTWLEDPGRPIPSEVVELTGITDEMVTGQRIDDAAVAATLEGAVLVVAHNAAFDRRMIERRLTLFDGVHWACSLRDVDWRAWGCRSARLEALLWERCAEFYASHRAADDCRVTLHVLAASDPQGARPMGDLIVRAREQTARVWAVHAPYAVKEQLKRRGYQWNSGDDGRRKAWYVEVPVSALEEEQEWLRATAYNGATSPPWVTQRFDAKVRFSARCDRA